MSHGSLFCDVVASLRFPRCISRLGEKDGRDALHSMAARHLHEQQCAPNSRPAQRHRSMLPKFAVRLSNKYSRTPTHTSIPSTIVSGSNMPPAGRNEPRQRKFSISSKDGLSTILPILPIFLLVLDRQYHSVPEGHVSGGAMSYVVGPTHPAFSSGH